MCLFLIYVSVYILFSLCYNTHVSIFCMNYFLLIIFNLFKIKNSIKEISYDFQHLFYSIYRNHILYLYNQCLFLFFLSLFNLSSIRNPFDKNLFYLRLHFFVYNILLFTIYFFVYFINSIVCRGCRFIYLH